MKYIKTFEAKRKNIFTAIAANDIESVKNFLNSDIKLNLNFKCTDYNSKSILIHCLRNWTTGKNLSEIFELLLDYSNEWKYNVDETTDLPIIFIAIQWNNMDAIKMLIDKGANPNIKTINSWGTITYPIFRASHKYNLIRLLIKLGTDPNVQQKSIKTGSSNPKNNTYTFEYLYDILSKTNQKRFREDFPDLYSDYLALIESEEYNL